MIDVHCHILPHIDDGPQDEAESTEMARIAATDGIGKIIATPHISDTRFSQNDIAGRVARLNRCLKQKDIAVEIYAGAEVSVTIDPETLSKYTLCDSPYILIEFPHDHLPSYAGRMLTWLCARGLKPILAHPERNYSIIRSPEILLGLLNKNIHLQITAASLTGDFGRDIQYCTHFLLDSGKVDIIASDAHSKDRRPPILSAAKKATEKRLGEKASRRLFITNPAAILTGEEIHPDANKS